MTRFAKKHTFKPTMEALETRWCPATSISPLQNGVVTVTGDDNNNDVVITQNDNKDTLIISTESGLRVFASSQVTDVVVNLNGGADRLTYRVDGGYRTMGMYGKAIRADLGSGNDTALFNLADNGTGGLAIDGYDLNIQAGAGNDQVDVLYGVVPHWAHDSLTGNMGYGDDHFNVEIKGSVGEYAIFHIDMEDMNDLVLRDPAHPWLTLTPLRGGNDDFRVTVDAGVPIGYGGDVLGVTLKGGDGTDNLQFQSQGKVDSWLTVVLDGGNGADTVTADIVLDHDSIGSVNATVLGGNGDDTLALQISNPATAAVQGLLDGGTGFDIAKNTLNSGVTVQNCEGFLFDWDLSDLHA